MVYILTVVYSVMVAYSLTGAYSLTVAYILTLVYSLTVARFGIFFFVNSETLGILIWRKKHVNYDKFGISTRQR